MNVLLAEDDRAVRQAIERALTLEGYVVEAVGDGASALEVHRERPADIIVLDVAMPVLDGLATCRSLRGAGDTVPVLMLTARRETSDRIAGLDAGADDYMPKPFELGELFARVRALVRRRRTYDAVGADESEQLTVADLTIDTAGHRVERAGVAIELTRTEFDLLELLVRNAGIVLDRSTIYERIWNYDFGPDSKNLAVYIGYLRRKIEFDNRPRLIHTVRGVGYVVRDDER